MPWFWFCCCLVTQSCLTLQTHCLAPARLLCPWDFWGKNTGVSWHFLLQGIFPIQGSNLSLLCLFLHCRQILYPLVIREAPILILQIDLFPKISLWILALNSLSQAKGSSIFTHLKKVLDFCWCIRFYSLSYYVFSFRNERLKKSETVF